MNRADKELLIGLVAIGAGGFVGILALVAAATYIVKAIL